MVPPETLSKLEVPPLPINWWVDELLRRGVYPVLRRTMAGQFETVFEGDYRSTLRGFLYPSSVLSFFLFSQEGLLLPIAIMHRLVTFPAVVLSCGDLFLSVLWIAGLSLLAVSQGQ